MSQRAYPCVKWLQSPTKTVMGNREYPYMVTVPVLVFRETEEAYIGMATEDLEQHLFAGIKSHWFKSNWKEMKEEESKC